MEFLDLRLLLSFAYNKLEMFSFRDPYQILLQLQDFQRGAVINL